MGKRIIDKPGEPMLAQSKMDGTIVSELEVKGIEELSKMEKKHLLLQLARERAIGNSVGPWEIVDILREEWRTVKATLVQPVEIDVRDIGKDALFQVYLDITELERDLEAAEEEAVD